MDSPSTLDLASLSPEDRKARVTELLTAMGDTHAGAEPEPTADERRSRFRLYMNLIFIATIFGSVLLLASSIYFHLIPAPLTYITTQDGRIIDLIPLKK